MEQLVMWLSRVSDGRIKQNKGEMGIWSHSIQQKHLHARVLTNNFSHFLFYHWCMFIGPLSAQTANNCVSRFQRYKMQKCLLWRKGRACVLKQRQHFWSLYYNSSSICWGLYGRGLGPLRKTKWILRLNWEFWEFLFFFSVNLILWQWFINSNFENMT